MITLYGTLMSVKELPARGDYPASALVSVFDEQGDDVLNLICDEATARTLSKTERMTPVSVRLKWRRVDLAQLGGSGKGRAYRLSIVGLVQ